jgi:hypothetical protein
MANRFDEIARRKEALIARCAQERDELSAALERIHLPLNLGAVFARLGRMIQSYPLAAGISSLLVTGYSVKLTRTAGKLMELARIFQPAWSWWSKRRSRK